MTNNTNDKPAARPQRAPLERSGADGPRERQRWGVRRGEAPRSRNEKLASIRRLYFETKPSTILRDFDRAIDILKSMDNERDRERATVYMQGLAEMRKEWKRR